MPVIGIVSIGVVQADVDAEVNLVVLRVPPTGINNLVCICRSIDGAIRNAVIHAVMTIVIDPVTKAVRPVSARARVADASLGRRRSGRRRRRTILARSIPGVCKDNVILGVVGSGMVEDGFLRGAAGIRRIEERRDWCLQRERTFRRGAAHTEEEATEQEG